ncbi:MAG: hypothetical protein ACKVQV_05750 [Bacteroidia bacterium]
METARLFSLTYKKLIPPVMWFLFFLLSYRVLARYPSGIFEVLFVLLVLLTSIISIRDIILQWLSGKANYFHLILIPLFILPFITSYQANLEFHQPILLGILSQRQHFIIFAGYFIVLGLKNNRFDIEDFRKHFLRSLIIIMGIMSFFSVFINPSVFNGTDFVEFSLNKGLHYEFPSDVIATVILYSMFKLLKENSKRYIVLLLMGLLYFLIYLQDRSQLMMIGITVFIFFIRNIDIYRKLLYLLWGIVGGSALLLIIYFANPELIEHYITIFGNASTIVTGESTTEYSTAMRISEAAIAIKGIKLHPLLGNGFVSSQFKGGFSGFFGYFFASDVGLLGNLFVYGIIGTLIFYIPFFVTLSWTKQLRKNNDILLTTCQYGMVFIFLDMITAASNIKYMGLPSIFFGIIYYYRYFIVNENKAETL